MIRSKRQIFSILFSIIAITLFVFLLTGCKNKNIALRDEAIAKAEVLIKDNVSYDETLKTSEDVFEGEQNVVAPETRRTQIKEAITTLKAIDNKKLTKGDVDKLNDLIKTLIIIKGSAMKVEFDLDGGVSTSAQLIVKVKKESTLTKAQIPTDITKNGFKFAGWEVDGKEIENIENYKIEKHTKFVASYLKSSTNKVEIAEDSINYIELDNNGGAIDFNNVPANTKLKFQLKNIPNGYSVKEVQYGSAKIPFDKDILKGEFTPTNSAKLKVVLEEVQYLLQYSNNLTNDKGIATNTKVNYGIKLVFKFQEDNTKIIDLKVNGEAIDITTLTKENGFYQYPLTMDKDYNLVLTYKAPEQYEVKYLGDGLTSSIASGTHVVENSLVTFTIAKKNFHDVQFKINGEVITNLEDKGTTYEYTHKVIANTEALLEYVEHAKYNLTYSGEGLSADQANNSMVYVNTFVKFTILNKLGKRAKLVINDQEIRPEDLITEGSNLVYTHKVVGNINAILEYIDTTTKYKVEILNNKDRVEYDQTEFPNLEEVLEFKRFIFNIKDLNAEEIVEVKVNGDVIAPNSENKYEVVVNENKQIAITITKKTYLVEFNGEFTSVKKGSENITSGQSFEKDTVLEFKYVDKENLLAKLTNIENTLLDVALVGTTYTYILTVSKVEKLTLNYVNARKLIIHEAQKQYFDVINANLDQYTNKVEIQGSSLLLQFKVKNVEEGKKIKTLTYNGQNLAIANDPNYVYQFTFEEDTTLNIEFETIRFTLIPNFANEHAKNYAKISTATEDNIQNATILDYNTEVSITKLATDPNFEYMVKVNQVEVTLPYTFNIKADTEIQVIATRTSAKVKFEFSTTQQMFEAGQFGTNIKDYATKNSFFAQEHDVVKGYVLPADKKAYFIDTMGTGSSSIHWIFDGFKIKGTDIRINFGDVIPLVDAEVVLVPVFKEGMYRTDLTINVYYLYEVINNGEMSLIEIGNIKMANSNQYYQVPSGKQVYIPTHEIVDYGNGKKITYNIVSIGNDATFNLKNAYVINMYMSGNSNIREIGDNNFNNIQNLTTITVGPKIKYVGLNCFNGNNNLATETYNNVKYLGGNNNPDHKYLIALGMVDTSKDKLEFHANTRVIMSGAFKNLTNLKEVVISEALRSIGKEAFAGCTNLEIFNFEIANNLELVASKAFKQTKITQAMLKTIKNKNVVIAADAI